MQCARLPSLRIGSSRIIARFAGLAKAWKSQVGARTSQMWRSVKRTPSALSLDPTVTLEPELVARVRERVRAHDPEGGGALIPDDLLERFAFAGTPEEVARQAEAVLDAGARRVDFGMPQGFELLCAQVLPRLRTGIARA